MTVWKYLLTGAELQSLPLPLGATVLTAAYQGTDLVVWVHVDPAAAATAARWFSVVDTGDPAPSLSESRYIATVMSPGGLVHHVFEMV